MSPSAQISTSLLEAVQKKLPSSTADCFKTSLQIVAVASQWYSSAVVLTSDYKAFAILRACNTEEEEKCEIFSSFQWSTWEVLKTSDFPKPLHICSQTAWLLSGASRWAPAKAATEITSLLRKSRWEIAMEETVYTAVAEVTDFYLLCF